eukprot:scaffold2179_cov83-Skeletonema_dohrnii-CCMP3373.AAC.1
MGMEEDVGEMQMITPGGGAGAGKNKAKNKNKKKKKHSLKVSQIPLTAVSDTKAAVQQDLGENDEDVEDTFFDSVLSTICT